MIVTYCDAGPECSLRQQRTLQSCARVLANTAICSQARQSSSVRAFERSSSMFALCNSLLAVCKTRCPQARLLSASSNLLRVGQDDEHDDAQSYTRRGQRPASGQQPFNQQFAKLRGGARPGAPRTQTDTIRIGNLTQGSTRSGRARRPRPAPAAWLQQYADKGTGEYEADYSKLGSVGKIVRACAPSALRACHSVSSLCGAGYIWCRTNAGQGGTTCAAAMPCAHACRHLAPSQARHFRSALPAQMRANSQRLRLHTAAALPERPRTGMQGAGAVKPARPRRPDAGRTPHRLECAPCLQAGRHVPAE